MYFYNSVFQGVPIRAPFLFQAVTVIFHKLCQPFIGRLDDIGQDGSKLVEDMVKVFRNYQFKTEIIAASVRNMAHVPF